MAVVVPCSASSPHRPAPKDVALPVEQLQSRSAQVQIALPHEQEDAVLDFIVENSSGSCVGEPRRHGGRIGSPSPRHGSFG